MAARRKPSGVGLAAAGVVGGLLVAFELIVRHTEVGGTGARTPSSLVTEAVLNTTGVLVQGWWALLVPVVLVFLVGLVIDLVSRPR